MTTLTIAHSDWEALEAVPASAVTVDAVTGTSITVSADRGAGSMATFVITGSWIGVSGTDLSGLDGFVTGISMAIDGVAQFDATDLGFDVTEVTEEVLGEVSVLVELALGNSAEIIGSDEDDTVSGTGGDDHIDGTLGDDDLFGDVGDDHLTGGLGMDSLDGGSGNDTLSGGSGDDSLVGAAGSDSLQAGIGTDSLSGGGGDDHLGGGAGADLLAGGIGLDQLAGGIGDDHMNGGADADTLSGGAGRDILAGGTGNDVVSGGTGKDVLSGGAGADVFSLDSDDAADADRVTDFVASDDTIQLENAVFTAFGTETGTLAAGHFTANAAGVALDADDFIVYDTDTGKIFDDADGNGAGAAVQIGIVGANLGLTAADFVLA
jgi:Ca2+-binding RTX toxin-like protein